VFVIQKSRCLLVGVAAQALFSLSACGGGGGAGGFVQSTPPPPVTPTPTPTPTPAITALNIIPNAPTGNLAVAGVTATGAILDPAMLTDASLAPGDQPQMRYDAATNTYEIKFPTGQWESLWTKDTLTPDWARAITAGESGIAMRFNFDRKEDAEDAFPYSTIASYSEPGTRGGMIAIGVPTPTGALPTSGSAQYDGVISGETNVFADNGSWGMALGVTGTVTLSFDFSAGSVSGSMQPVLSSGDALGVFSFKNGVYSSGGYSGQFNTPANGVNGFYGQMTGPHAEELIGAWALPFHYHGDNQDHQAIGAWVAKH
jgi:hypothetical protein